jgi:hypothetical protein
MKWIKSLSTKDSTEILLFFTHGIYGKKNLPWCCVLGFNCKRICSPLKILLQFCTHHYKFCTPQIWNHLLKRQSEPHMMYVVFVTRLWTPSHAGIIFKIHLFLKTNFKFESGLFFAALTVPNTQISVVDLNHAISGRFLTYRPWNQCMNISQLFWTILQHCPMKAQHFDSWQNEATFLFFTGPTQAWGPTQPIQLVPGSLPLWE